MPEHRVALVTQGFATGGGVPAVVRWLRAGLASTGDFDVDVHDLATSSRDVSSRRIIRPRSWTRRSLRAGAGSPDGYVHWGANAVELEFMRYRPRRELTRALQNYDLIQVVSGSAALACVVRDVRRPVVLQFATRVRWERESQLAARHGGGRIWRQGMTRIAEQQETSALRQVDAVLVENEAAAEYARACGQGTLVKAAPGVDTARFSPASSWSPSRYLLSVCRLGEPRKGIDRLVTAYAIMRRAMPDVPRLVLAGRGELAGGVRDLIARNGLTDCVTVCPDVPAAELPDLYRGASVFLQASHEEGFGIAVVEAMTSGLPVVATATDGARETLVDGETGWLVHQGSLPETAQSLAERALQVLRGDGGRMATAGRLRAQTEYSNLHTFERVRRLYDTLLAPSGSHRPCTTAERAIEAGLRACGKPL